MSDGSFCGELIGVDSIWGAELEADNGSGGVRISSNPPAIVMRLWKFVWTSAQRTINLILRPVEMNQSSILIMDSKVFFFFRLFPIRAKSSFVNRVFHRDTISTKRSVRVIEILMPLLSEGDHQTRPP
jgi:hypothetical protein